MDCFSVVPASEKSDSVELPILGTLEEGDKIVISFDRFFKLNVLSETTVGKHLKF